MLKLSLNPAKAGIPYLPVAPAIMPRRNGSWRLLGKGKLRCAFMACAQGTNITLTRAAPVRMCPLFHAPWGYGFGTVRTERLCRRA